MKRKKGMFDKQKEKHRKKHHFIPPNFFFLRKMAYLLKEKEGKVLEIKMYFSALKKFFFSHKKTMLAQFKKKMWSAFFQRKMIKTQVVVKIRNGIRAFLFQNWPLGTHWNTRPRPAPILHRYFPPNGPSNEKIVTPPCKMTIFSTENLNYAHKYPKWAFCCGWTTMNIRCK